MSWFLTVLKKYAVFEGRARRKEYWMYTLIYIIFYAALFYVDILLGSGGLLAFIYSLALLLPTIAVVVRRFHDQDKSGWFALLVLVPIVGGLIVLVFMCLDGTPGPNRFGESPKAIGGGDGEVPATA